MGECPSLAASTWREAVFRVKVNGLIELPTISLDVILLDRSFEKVDVRKAEVGQACICKGNMNFVGVDIV
jgi:hypothetical protein